VSLADLSFEGLHVLQKWLGSRHLSSSLLCLSHEWSHLLEVAFALRLKLLIHPVLIQDLPTHKYYLQPEILLCLPKPLNEPHKQEKYALEQCKDAWSSPFLSTYHHLYQLRL